MTMDNPVHTLTQNSLDLDFRFLRALKYLRVQAPGPKTENILKSKFQTNITFEVVWILGQNFDIVFECTYC